MYNKRIIILILVFSMLLSGCSKNEAKEADTPLLLEATVQADLTPTEDLVEPTFMPTEEPLEPTLEPTIHDTIAVTLPENLKPSITYTSIYSEDFESGVSDFKPRGSETVEIADEGYNSGKALVSKNRTETWNGQLIDLSESMTAGNQYE